MISSSALQRGPEEQRSEQKSVVVQFRRRTVVRCVVAPFFNCQNIIATQSVASMSRETAWPKRHRSRFRWPTTRNKSAKFAKTRRHDQSKCILEGNLARYDSARSLVLSPVLMPPPLPPPHLPRDCLRKFNRVAGFVKCQSAGYPRARISCVKMISRARARARQGHKVQCTRITCSFLEKGTGVLQRERG